MKKYPTIRGSLLVCLTSLLTSILLPVASEARIGERRESLERRLFASGGIVYRDDAIEENRRRGMPYMGYFEHLPDSADIRIYFKTSDGRRPTSSELEEKRVSAGWDLHVVYVGGKSVVEVYKRNPGMTEYEMNHLLTLHSNGGHWKRVSKEERAEAVSAFGFDMVRSDGRVRAKKLGGNSVMLFDTEVDEKLANLDSNDKQEKAPISVEGF